MENSKSKHGGRRPGAGRKPTGKNKKNVTLTFSPNIIDILKSKGRRKSEYIESLIMKDVDQTINIPVEQID